jgi:hypothetical protein
VTFARYLTGFLALAFGLASLGVGAWPLLLDGEQDVSHRGEADHPGGLPAHRPVDACPRQRDGGQHGERGRRQLHGQACRPEQQPTPGVGPPEYERRPGLRADPQQVAGAPPPLRRQDHVSDHGQQAQRSRPTRRDVDRRQHDVGEHHRRPRHRHHGRAPHGGRPAVAAPLVTRTGVGCSRHRHRRRQHDQHPAQTGQHGQPAAQSDGHDGAPCRVPPGGEHRQRDQHRGQRGGDVDAVEVPQADHERVRQPQRGREQSGGAAEQPAGEERQQPGHRHRLDHG